MTESLWGHEFDIPEQDIKKLIKKVENPKIVVKTVEQLLKSKKTTLEERLKLITENVKKILGKFIEQTLVIRSKEQLVEYFDTAIRNGIIALDTETNNSLQPITCKLMGPCLYTPGLKAAYVPINHRDPKTNELLSNQLTEEDVAEQLKRLVDTKIIMHNGKFDYKVFKCTTGVELSVYWDTLLGAKILNENEEGNLKTQYITHIDKSMEKYSIEHLFEGVEYAVVSPEIFALYAATDSFMTYKLYEWQKEQFSIPGNERIYNVFKDVEMQVMPATAEMELTGLEIDKAYTQLLANKYHKLLDDVDKKIEDELAKYAETINKWRQTPEANFHPPKKNGKGEAKSMSEMLENPINLGSPSQLAILLYDILQVEPPDPKKPRGTGEDELKAIKLPLCKVLLERRGIVKLVDAFIDSLPNEILEKTGRVHANFNQYGAKTGRYSCSGPNLQQIPSRNRDIRLMFKAGTLNNMENIMENYCELYENTEVETLSNGWQKVKDLKIGDKLIGSLGIEEIVEILKLSNKPRYKIKFKEVP